MKIKRIVATALTAVMCVSGGVATIHAANETITVHNTKDEGLYMSIFDKRADLGDAKIFIDENDRTQMPVRAVSELLNASVNWDDKTRTVTVTRDDTVLKLQIGSNIMYKNDDIIKMDTEAVVVNDLTYIPLKYIGEGLGCIIAYTESKEPFEGQMEIYDGVPEEVYNSMHTNN